MANALAPSIAAASPISEPAHFANSGLWIVQWSGRGSEHRVDRGHPVTHVAHVGAALEAGRQLVDGEELAPQGLRVARKARASGSLKRMSR